MADSSSYSFTSKVLVSVTVLISLLLIVLFVGYAIDVLLLIFAGVLLGTILRSFRDFIHRFTRLPNGVSLALVVLIMFSTIGTIGYMIGPDMYQQAQRLYVQLPQEWERLKGEIYQYEWGKQIIREDPQPSDVFESEVEDEGKKMTRNILSLFSLTIEAVVGTVFVLVIAIYIAAEPHVYSRGLLRLFPPGRRDRIMEVLGDMAMAIQWWLIGQITSMFILGAVTTLGLWWLGMPYALILGLFTALMTFIPNIGPIIAGIPTMLIAFTVSLQMALYVFIFYLIIQSIEGYFITPMIHRKAISVPPVLILSAQFLLYFLIGFVGVLVAMPLIACLMVLVQKLYVEDVLGDSMDEKLEQDAKGNIPV